jgi:hypothetical protein
MSGTKCELFLSLFVARRMAKKRGNVTFEKSSPRSKFYIKKRAHPAKMEESRLVTEFHFIG